jgi:hypothetical protein
MEAKYETKLTAILEARAKRLGVTVDELMAEVAYTRHVLKTLRSQASPITATELFAKANVKESMGRKVLLHLVDQRQARITSDRKIEALVRIVTTSERS